MVFLNSSQIHEVKVISSSTGFSNSWAGDGYRSVALEKLSSMKPVPGAKKVGDCCSSRQDSCHGRGGHTCFPSKAEVVISG